MARKRVSKNAKLMLTELASQWIDAGMLDALVESDGRDGAIKAVVDATLSGVMVVSVEGDMKSDDGFSFTFELTDAGVDLAQKTRLLTEAPCGSA